MAETIENNVRRIILDEMAVNPRYYEEMSGLLDALIRRRKQEALDYQAYLAKIVDLTKRIGNPETRSSYPPGIDSGALRALFDNLDALVAPLPPAVREKRPRYDDDQRDGVVDARAGAAVAIDCAIRRVKKADWRGNRIKEREVRNAIGSVLGNDADFVDRIFEIVKAQRDY